MIQSTFGSAPSTAPTDFEKRRTFFSGSRPVFTDEDINSLPRQMTD